jgi:uncharacterized protein YndB with AHSA1/START domain
VATNQTYVKAPPEAVFDVLADPESYGHWVVGASRTEPHWGEWPEEGAQFRHVQGVLGLGLSDTTRVVCANRPRQVVLEARVAPFAINKVEVRLRPHGDGTRVTLVEYPIGGIAGLLHNPVLDGLTRLRNRLSLRRLARMAEERAVA